MSADYTNGMAGPLAHVEPRRGLSEIAWPANRGNAPPIKNPRKEKMQTMEPKMVFVRSKNGKGTLKAGAGLMLFSALLFGSLAVAALVLGHVGQMEIMVSAASALCAAFAFLGFRMILKNLRDDRPWLSIDRQGIACRRLKAVPPLVPWTEILWLRVGEEGVNGSPTLLCKMADFQKYARADGFSMGQLVFCQWFLSLLSLAVLGVLAWVSMEGVHIAAAGAVSLLATPKFLSALGKLKRLKRAGVLQIQVGDATPDAATLAQPIDALVGIDLRLNRARIVELMLKTGVPAAHFRPAAAPLRLEMGWIRSDDAEDAGKAPLVFLHEGLGCLSAWKDFPKALCNAAGKPGLVYSRQGYGHSAARSRPWPLDCLEVEAWSVLPSILEAQGVEKPWLIGHSDGGTIALLAASRFSEKLAGIVVIAPHWFVEDKCLDGIGRAKAAYESGTLKEKLQRCHDDPDGVFYGWHDVWTDPVRRAWNISAACKKIKCPVFALQGDKDEYATQEQIEGIGRFVPQAECCTIPDCGHFPHLHRQDELAAAIAAFIDGQEEKKLG
jgi:pimeloyl-ACP methyl ester carboxylesterase